MSCNEFKLYRTIVAQYGRKSMRDEDYEEENSSNVDKTRSASAKTYVKSVKPKTPMEQRLLRRAIGALESREGSPWIMRVKIKPMMLRLDPSFDEANHGYSNFTAFLEGCTDVIDLKETNSDVLVRVKRNGKSKTSPKPAVKPAVKPALKTATKTATKTAAITASEKPTTPQKAEPTPKAKPKAKTAPKTTTKARRAPVRRKKA